MKNNLKIVALLFVGYGGYQYLCIIKKAKAINHTLNLKVMANVFQNLTIEQKTEYAMQIVLLDAIERGATTKNDLIQYMKSDVFTEAVKAYVSMM